MVNDVVSKFIMGVFQLAGFIYIISKLEDKKINFKNIINCLIFILISLVTVMVHYLFNNMLRPVITLIIFILFFKKMFKLSITESVLDCFIGYIVIVISELIVLILLFVVLRLSNDILTNYFINTVYGGILNFIILIIVSTILQNKLINIRKKLISKINNNFLWIMIISLSAFLSIYVYNNQPNINFIFTTLSCSLIIIIILYLFKEILDKNAIKDEYDKLFNYNENTESLLTKYQKYNHENKNQLILIKESLNDKGKTVKLIDEILDDDIKHTDKWLDQLKNIPSGGLKGFLSYKINYMIDNCVNVYVSISPKLRKISLYDIFGVKFYKEICQIIGVYIDNAHEACLKSNEKVVSIEMFCQEDKINIIISNSFDKNINTDLIGKSGYTTKGEGHGIGLSLVKDIVNQNKFINTNKQVINNYYYQHIIIDQNE